MPAGLWQQSQLSTLRSHCARLSNAATSQDDKAGPAQRITSCWSTVIGDTTRRWSTFLQVILPARLLRWHLTITYHDHNQNVTMSYALQDEIIQELAASTGRQWIMLVTCKWHLLGGLALSQLIRVKNFCSSGFMIFLASMSTSQTTILIQSLYIHIFKQNDRYSSY